MYSDQGMWINKRYIANITGLKFITLVIDTAADLSKFEAEPQESKFLIYFA